MRSTKYVLFVVLFFLAGCSVPELEPLAKAPPTPFFGEEVTGTATWYGPLFHGRITDSGDAFDMEKLTASHRSFPLGTQVQVTNPENGSAVMVTINDRHNVNNDIQFCLSKKAAKRIGVYPKKQFTVTYMMIK